MTPPRPRVLVIDDEESMRFFLKRALARRGFEVDAADDGPSGLARFEDFRPDAVLLDVKLPGMGGREVLERIRSRDGRIPVLMMTGFASVDDAMGAMWAGATDYVRKPLKADEVAGALDRALAARDGDAPGPATVRSLARGPSVVPASPRSAPATASPAAASLPAPHDPPAWLRAECAVRGLEGGAGDGADLTLEEASRRFERIFVDELLRRSGGNVARAARAAGITRPNFHRKLRSLGLDAETYRKG